jgi:hypothetical protein
VDDTDEVQIIRLNRQLLQAADVFAKSFGLDPAARAGSFTTAFVLTGDQRFVDRATAYAQLAVDNLAIGPYVDSSLARVAGSLAVAYDTFYPHLQGEDRDVWQGLLGEFLELYLVSARTRHQNCIANEGASLICNAGGGTAALALLPSNPDAIESLQLARKLIHTRLDHCCNTQKCQCRADADRDYGIEDLLRFAWMLERALGSDDGILSQPIFANLSDQIHGATGGSTAEPREGGIDTPVCNAETSWFVANRFGDSLALSYGDRVAKAAAPRKDQDAMNWWGLIWRPESPQ